MDENLLKKVPVKVQKKSGFDLSFQNLLTTKVGTITPVLCEELIPNETVHLDAAIQAQLPPLASDTFMRCDLKYEAFFVPSRLVMAGYEEWLVPNSQYSAGNTATTLQPKVPLLKMMPYQFRAGTLADYLGVKSEIPGNFTSAETANYYTSADTITVNALPFLAYHRIYDDWYRNTLVQKPIYDIVGYTSSTANTYSASRSRQVVPCITRGYVMSGGTSQTFADGSYVTDLRQRNFGLDRFTTATPSAQNGDAQGLLMTVNNSQAGFTIGQLRAANAIQQWLERNNLCGNRLVDYVKGNYGANLHDGVAQRSLLLGSGKFAVYSKGIYQTAPNPDSGVDTRNPFNVVAAQYGSAFASGSEEIIGSFTAAEPGYLFVLCTLVPKVTYGTGIDRKLIRYTTNSRTDMANPMLQGTGNEPIWMSELSVVNAMQHSGALTGTGLTFGYQERYADWKCKHDELHGLLRDKASNFNYADTDDKLLGSLASFALQSDFPAVSSLSISISDDFLEIPKNYLDQVSATAGDVSDYGCWIDSYFNFKVTMPLARYSLPTLQDPAYEHGDDIILDRGGSRL